MSVSRSTWHRQIVLVLVLFMLVPVYSASAQSANSVAQPATHTSNSTAPSWIFVEEPATNPQPWPQGCPSPRALEDGSVEGQLILDMHTNWHCMNMPTESEEHGRRFLAFHRQLIVDYDNWRLRNGADRVEYWDAFPNAAIPGDDETTNTPFTHCITTPGNTRPAGALCEGCARIPDAFVGRNLASISNLGVLGYRLEQEWHAEFHIGVAATGCTDMRTANTSPNDPTFYMAHKKLDELARDWQSLQATDVVIVLDRSGSMDDNCPGQNANPGESPCAINDAREAALTFANLVQDQRLEGALPAPEQHRLALVSFADSASVDLELTPALGIVSNDAADNTPFEIGLGNLSPNGSTSIAAGIRAAIDVLESTPNPNRHQAVLVLTDGKENQAPCLGGNSPSDCNGERLTAQEIGDIQIVAIGFGEGAEEANLRDVAERHGGIFIAQPNVEPIIISSLNLQKFFVTAFGNIFDEVISLDPVATLSPGQAASAFFSIDIADEERLIAVLGWSKTNHVITFEDYPPLTDIVANYQASHGVSFSPTNAEPLLVAPSYINVPSQGTASGTQALKSGYTVGELSQALPIGVNFASAQSYVRVAVGLNTPTASAAEITLTAFDANDNVIKEVVTQIGPGPTPVTTFMEIASDQVNIASLTIKNTSADFSVSREGVAIDDLEFTNHLPNAHPNASPCDLQLELYAPSGVLLNRTSTNIESASGARHDFIRVNFPYQGESTGTWTGRVIRQDPSCGPQPYFYSHMVKGNGRVVPFSARPNVSVGHPLLAAFRISESDRPVGGFDNVEAQVTLTRPNGETDTYPLYDDGTNGDKLAGNYIWSHEIPDLPALPGTYHLRAHFSLTTNGVTHIREAEHAIVVQPAPTQCTSAFASASVNAGLWDPPQPNRTIPLRDFVCIRNLCVGTDEYEINISDSQGWLKILDPQTGQPSALPPSFPSGGIATNGYTCFGAGPEQDHTSQKVPLLAVIPDSAAPGDQTLISVTVNSTNHDHGPTYITAPIKVYAPPDCNENGIPDVQDVADKTSKDLDNDGVPDVCQRSMVHHGHSAIDLSITALSDPATIAIDEPWAYNLDIANAGQGVASSVIFSITLPSSVDLVPATSTRGTCTTDNKTITCRLGELEPSTNVSITLLLTPTALGSLTIEAGVIGYSGELQQISDKVSSEILVTEQIPFSGLFMPRLGR